MRAFSTQDAGEVRGRAGSRCPLRHRPVPPGSDLVDLAPLEIHERATHELWIFDGGGVRLVSIDIGIHDLDMTLRNVARSRGGRDQVRPGVATIHPRLDENIGTQIIRRSAHLLTSRFSPLHATLASMTEVTRAVARRRGPIRPTAQDWALRVSEGTSVKRFAMQHIARAESSPATSHGGRTENTAGKVEGGAGPPRRAPVVSDGPWSSRSRRECLDAWTHSRVALTRVSAMPPRRSSRRAAGPDARSDQSVPARWVACNS
jgi:hypothetical protein